MLSVQARQLKFLAEQIAASDSQGTGEAAAVLEVNPDDWLHECAAYFKEQGPNPRDPRMIYGTNYDLVEKSSGLCQNQLSCAFERCQDNGGVAKLMGMNLTAKTYHDAEQEVGGFGVLNLPSKITFPKTAGDVVQAIHSARDMKLTVSVKSSGSSFFGAGTFKESLQLNLRNLKKYSSSSTGVTECVAEAEEEESYSKDEMHPCRLALDRKKSAIVRVGGGESWSDVYLAVLAFNKASSGKKYEVVGAANAGLGAAGGWLQGGGWSHVSDRLHGLGVDQVLEMEMVLPDGRHVKFGPSTWNVSDKHLYPQTTSVEGRCNTKVDADEEEWTWEPCEGPFDDLWFAVRGGGGGNWGVVTAVTYQLHDHVPVTLFEVNTTRVAEIQQVYSANEKEQIERFFIDFFTAVLYNPEEVGLDDDTSKHCGSPSMVFIPWSLYPFQLYCYDPAQEALAAAWQKRVDDSNVYMKQLLDGLLVSRLVVGWSEKLLAQFDGLPLYQGKQVVADFPWPQYVPIFGQKGWVSGLVPERWFREAGKEDIYAIFSNIAVWGGHTTGMNVGVADDGWSAVTTEQRTSGLSAVDLSWVEPEAAERLLQFMTRDAETGGDFPAITEPNHVYAHEFGPLKSNLTALCPEDFSVAEKEEKCVNIKEAIWGTKRLARLENIKASLDPENLFRCSLCIGTED